MPEIWEGASRRIGVPCPFVSTAELILVAVAAAAIVTWYTMRRDRQPVAVDATSAPEVDVHPADAISPDLERRIHTLVGENRKIYAIKELRDHTGMSLREAKELVDLVVADRPMTGTPVDHEMEERLRTMVGEKRKVYAIKELRDHTGMGLRQAKEFVDSL